MIQKTYCAPILLLLAVGVLAVPSNVFAGGFATSRFGGEHGHVASDHITSMYYNPSALAFYEGTRVYLEGLGAWRKLDYNRPVEAIDNVIPDGDNGLGTPQSAIGINSGDASLTNFVGAPFLGVSTDLGFHGLALAAGVYAPFGGQAKWDRVDNPDPNYPGAIDGPNRWAATEGSLRTLYYTLAAAYAFKKPRVSIGASFNLNQSSVSTLRARTAGGNDHLVNNGTPFEGRSLVDGSAITWSFGVGLTWEPWEDTLWVGASYQSPPGFDELKMEGTLRTKLGTAPESLSDSDFTQEMPDVLSLGFRFRPISALEVRLSGMYTRWSRYKNNCILDGTNPDSKCAIAPDGSIDTANGGAGVVINVVRGWNDSITLRGSVSYFLSDTIELLGGLSFDENAVPDNVMDTTFVDSDKYSASLGARFKLNRSIGITATYTQLLYASREIATDLPNNHSTFVTPSRNPEMSGTYKQMLGFLLLGAEYEF